MKVSFVIAAYNEEGTVQQLTERIYTVVKQHNIPYEIIYALAGTRDAYAILTMLQKKIRHLKLFYTKKPEGLGNAFRFAFSKVARDSDYVVTMDADLNHQPEEVPRFLKAVKTTNADVIIGSRYVKGAKRERIPFWKRLLSDLINAAFTIIYGLRVKDKTSGYRLYKKKALDTIRFSSVNFEFLPEILILAKRQNLKLVEVPITFKYRVIGTSKLNLIKTATGYLKLISKTIFR